MAMNSHHGVAIRTSSIQLRSISSGNAAASSSPPQLRTTQLRPSSTARRTGRVSMISGNIWFLSPVNRKATGRSSPGRAIGHAKIDGLAKAGEHALCNILRHPAHPEVLFALKKVLGGFVSARHVFLAIDQKCTDLGIGQPGLTEIFGNLGGLFGQPGCRTDYGRG